MTIDPLSIALLLLAPLVGSFLGVLAMRLPEHRTVLMDRSRCDGCNTVLGARDLVPLASWLWLRGKCRHCRAAIGAFPVLMESGALVVVVCAAFFTAGLVLVATCILGWLLLALAAADWRTYTLPDPLNAALTLAGLAATWFLNRDAMPDHVIAVLAGFAVFAALALLYRRLRGREGLGLGDAKLLGALGAWVSWQGLPSVVLYGAVLGLAATLIASLAGRKLSATTRVPFGTFLALGGWLVWLLGPVLVG